MPSKILSLILLINFFSGPLSINATTLNFNQDHQNSSNGISILTGCATDEIQRLTDEEVETFFNHLRGLLPEISSIQEELVMLDNTDIEIGPDTKWATAVYSLALKNIRLDGEILAFRYLQLIEAGLPNDQALEILAIQYVPTIAHELRHALNHWGVPVFLNVAEEEASGFTSHLAALNELRQKFPHAYQHATQATENDAIMWNFWRQRGYDGLIERIKKIYGIPSIFNSEGITQLKKRSLNPPQYTDLIETYQQKIEKCRQGSLPESWCQKWNGVDIDIDQWIDQETNGEFNNRVEYEYNRELLREAGYLAGNELSILQWQAYYEGEKTRALNLWSSQFESSPIP